MATASIQVPMLETKRPVHTVANARCRNGRNGDTRFGWAGLVTRPGYPDPRAARPRAQATLPRFPGPRLLQRDPEDVEALGDATEPAAALEDWRPASEDAAA